ncbi:HSPB1-associated protein 1 [Solenopsis invicta]|uniref:HSPB1-associated protein 1 n=1 Tax=Solenopsis invicta TaxID=13686 RepID=UPI000595D389|nr:HSPB1-associated protein 1 [Solenopsis invicta]
MSRHLRPSEEVLKEALPVFTEPVLFQNMLQNSDGSYEWKLLKWSPTELVEKFGDKKLPFRVGDHNKRTCALQHQEWSLDSPIPKPVQLTLQEFIDLQETKEDNKWYYCDYKHVKEWLSDNTEIIESFNWLKFGIDKKHGENGMNSTFWIGSKGAHTDCHWDTYGYNLVAQIHGRKKWLLYPPNADLIPVRLPYEESTVYSRFNIYCLSEEEEDYVLNIEEKPKLITLEPGDVLFIPNGWWHYVESLDQITMSVNIWGDLRKDNKARVEEALVKLIVARVGDFTQFSNKETKYYTRKVEDALFEWTNKIKDEEEKGESVSEMRPAKRRKLNQQTTKELAEEYPHYVKLLSDADEQEFKEFIEERRKRYDEKDPSDRESASGNYIPNPQYDSFYESIINALCHPEVVRKAAKILLDRHY